MIRILPSVLVLLGLLAGCSKDAPETSSPSDQSEEIQIAVLVPEETPTLYLTGNLPELGPWNPSGLAMSGEGRERTISIQVPQHYNLEYKFTLGSWDREALSESGAVMPNFELFVDAETSITHEIINFKQDPKHYMENWQESGVIGRLAYWPDVTSGFLSESRHVSVWLPPEYDANPAQRFRVLYMHDGQNLFDPRMASMGTDWGVDEAMMSGADQFEPAIVVGVWNSSRRMEEYSPWHEAKNYARFLIEELIPRVNAEYRTQTGPENTFVMGSSMGGLLSYYLVKEHPEVFGACGCVSTHFPLSEAVASRILTGTASGDSTPYILNDIEAGASIPEGARLFFDYGTEGLDASYGPTHDAVQDWLADQGLEENSDYIIREYAGADHNEASWRARLGDQLAWLLSESVD